MNLRIIEWNINQRMNYSHKNMPNWIADVITHEAADIIALTEVYKGIIGMKLKQHHLIQIMLFLKHQIIRQDKMTLLLQLILVN